MELTLDDLKNIVKEMEKENATRTKLDFYDDGYGSIESIDFDLWKDGVFLKTILTIEK